MFRKKTSYEVNEKPSIYIVILKLQIFLADKCEIILCRYEQHMDHYTNGGIYVNTEPREHMGYFGCH